MQLTNRFTKTGGRESTLDALSLRLTQLETSLNTLREEMEYGFDNIDETNLTAETVEKLSLADTAQTDTVSVGQFAAGLRLSLKGRELGLSSGSIPLNTVRLPEPGIKDYEAVDACWPVGSVYLTALDGIWPEDILGVGEWEDVTPLDSEFYYYERVE